ncbi:hypothetical protein [Streptomyces sp. ATCC 21386]|uniref:hypothetical protein n=1 Tax=Streptomyces sp. ATCC 21386 TaxID=2699428 RepID=UPI0027E5AFB6|nr:hypothetical protein [Streptomyces sp. ATCC 21386]
MTATASAGGPRTVTGRSTDPITRIAGFQELKAWEKWNNADGVRHAQNTPVRWKVTDNGPPTTPRPVLPAPGATAGRPSWSTT